MQVGGQERLAVFSSDQHAPPIAVSRSVATRPPWMIGPDGAGNAYAGEASHSNTDSPPSCDTRR